MAAPTISAGFPDRFAVWERLELEEQRIGIFTVYDAENYINSYRFKHARIPSHMRQYVRGRIVKERPGGGSYFNVTINTTNSEARVDFQENIRTEYCNTPFYIRIMQPNAEPLPVFLFSGRFSYTSYRPVDAYVIDTMNFYPWIEDFQSLYANFSPRGQTRWRADTPIWTDAEEYDLDISPPLTQPTARQPANEKPSERIALAIARDFIQHQEVCPITQDSLRPGRIAVTGCMCVFQAEPLEEWAIRSQTCPSCRKALVYRIVRIPQEQQEQDQPQAPHADQYYEA